MSGRFNNPAVKLGGWEEWTSRRDSPMQKYVNELVIVVAGGKYKTLYISQEVLRRLKNPKRVKIMVRGNNAAIVASEDEDTGFTVRYPLSREEAETKGGSHSTMPFIAPTAFLKNFGLVPGAYRGHFENDMLIFDMMQIPARV